jgi:predicted alpha/beta hydrolase family esterase
MSAPPILVLPGYGDSGPEHWQSVWEAADPRARRVVQRDWLEPRLDDWLAVLDREISACPTPPVLVAHSLGCVLAAHWVARTRRTVAGAMLVAPADVDAIAVVLDAVASFAPVPLIRLPFPSIVVVSDDDSYAPRERAAAFARAWGSRLVVFPGIGHINSESGLGAWPQGRALLDELLTRVAGGP